MPPLFNKPMASNPMLPMQQPALPISTAISRVLPGNNVSAVNPPNAVPVLTAPIPKIPNAPYPKEFTDTLLEASKHTSIPVDTMVRHFTAENGGVWSPTLKGRSDPSDFGVTQLNRNSSLKDITGANGGTNFFKNVYGHDFNANDAHDQILGAAVYLNKLKQFDLPAVGIKNPTLRDILLSYNMGAKGYSDSLKPKASQDLVDRRNTYEKLLRSHGIHI